MALAKEVQEALAQADEEGNLQWWEGMARLYRQEITRLDAKRTEAIHSLERAKRKIAELTGKPLDTEVCWFCLKLLSECQADPCEPGEHRAEMEAREKAQAEEVIGE